MSSPRSYDTAVDGGLDSAGPVEFRRAEGTPRLEDLAVRRPKRLDSGRELSVEPGGDGTDRVTVRAPDGRVELEVTLTERGPVLHFRSAELDLETAGAVRIRCDELDMEARGGIRQVAGGDLEQVALGDARLRASGDLEAEGDATRIRSRRGDVRIQANDDVRLNGERVKLNCT